MKKSKQIEMLKADNEHLYKLLRELIDEKYEKDALELQLFKIREIVNARKPCDPAGEIGVIGGNACDHLAIYDGTKWPCEETNNTTGGGENPVTPATS